MTMVTRSPPMKQIVTDRKDWEGKLAAESSSVVSPPEICLSSWSSAMDHHPQEVDDMTTSSGSLSDSTSGSLDPYADVRDRMEELASRDRARFAFHQGEEEGTSIGGNYNKEAKRKHQQQDDEAIPTVTAFTTYVAYAVSIVTGHFLDLVATVFGRGRYIRRNTDFTSDNPKTFAPLLKSWENFYTRRLYHRLQDCFNRPIASNPGAHIRVLERLSRDRQKTMELVGRLDELETEEQKEAYTSGAHHVLETDGRVSRSCLNLGSYNYLGFADDWNATCEADVTASLKDMAVGTGSSRAEFGSTSLHCQVEELVARFIGKEEAMVLNMGFNTNATTIPALVSRGDLLISDQLNHTSIVNGARASGASIRTFRHNDMEHLEEILREAIVFGRPRSRRPWNKILVIVEGIYSMEGEYCDLKNIVRLAKKYGAYTYLDEAHSIGAMGPTGRGCTEYTGIDPADVDIMMGTFTKSFGAMGGYIAGSKEVISFLRRRCAGSSYHNALSPVVCQQIITSLKVIMGEDGTDIGKQKIAALRDNSNYFRMRLKDMGLQVLGHYDSPIMPVMLYNPTKISSFSRECFKRGLAVVVVGFPAVPILLSRARFCISAGHTRDDLDRALTEIDEIADITKLRYEFSSYG